MCQNSNIPISGTLLQEEALIIAEKLNIKGFYASNGWLESFKLAQNIGTKKVTGKGGDVNQVTVESWKERLKEILKGWSPEDVWNMDKTGCFWWGLPETSLNHKGDRCRGGKKLKQRNTWAFFVNAAGEKEAPVIISNSQKPRYFKKLKNGKRPYGCPYFANKKAWMNSDIMAEILTTFDNRMKRKGRKILLFLDNAPCHPPTLQDHLSNITLKFLPKNTTAKTQPLDSGIIANWKVKYKKRLLRFVCSKIDGSRNGSEIVKSVNLLMNIEWGKQAWDEVSAETIAKCFKSTCLYPDKAVEGEDSLELQQALTELGSDVTAEEYIADESDFQICSSPLDPSDPNWRETAREEILCENPNSRSSKQACLTINSDDSESDKSDNDDDSHQEKQPSIRSATEGLKFAEMIQEFSRYHGKEDLSLAMSKVVYLLQGIKTEGRKQSRIEDFFSHKQ